MCIRDSLCERGKTSKDVLSWLRFNDEHERIERLFYELKTRGITTLTIPPWFADELRSRPWAYRKVDAAFKVDILGLWREVLRSYEAVVSSNLGSEFAATMVQRHRRTYLVNCEYHVGVAFGAPVSSVVYSCVPKGAPEAAPVTEVMWLDTPLEWDAFDSAIVLEGREYIALESTHSGGLGLDGYKTLEDDHRGGLVRKAVYSMLQKDIKALLKESYSYD